MDVTSDVCRKAADLAILCIPIAPLVANSTAESLVPTDILLVDDGFECELINLVIELRNWFFPSDVLSLYP